MRKIDTIVPYYFEGHLIIALHNDWITKFGKIPTFVVVIDDNSKLHLISNEVIGNES